MADQQSSDAKPQSEPAGADPQGGAVADPEAQSAGGADPEAQGAGGAQKDPEGAGAAPLPFYKKPLVLACMGLGLALILVLALLMHQKSSMEREALAQRQGDLARLRAQNDAREAYIRDLERLLSLDPCDVEAGLAAIAPPEGRSLPQLPRTSPAPKGGQAAPGAGQAPPQAEAPKAAPSGAGDKPARTKKGPSTSNELLEQATVFVIAPVNDDIIMGTGFFIAPDTIMTNAHVVGDARGVVITNERLGAVRSATVILRTQRRGLDFAVLKTEQPLPVTPLRLSATMVSKTEKVCAWGYPAAVSRADPKMLGLLQGDPAATPSVIFSEGSVNVVLDRKPPIIVHSATVSQGNSGGPLVNKDGSVVGINTMISLDDQSYRQSSLAIPSTVMIDFLKANGVPYSQGI